MIKKQTTLDIRHLFEYLPLQYMLDFYDENSSWLQKMYGIYTDDKNKNVIIMLQHYLFISSNCQQSFIEDFFKEIIDESMIKQLGVVFLFFNNDLPIIDTSLLSKFKPYVINRLLYKFDKYNSENHLKEVIPIKEAFSINIPGLDIIIEEVTSTGTYLDMSDFLENGDGYTFVIDNCVEGFCTTEYPSKKSVAFGISVNEEYQHQGYGKSMAISLVNSIKSKNLSKDIYWDCFKENVASKKTAEASGFKLINDYKVIFLPLRKKDEE